MHSVTLAAPDDFAGWRASARALIGGNIAPEDITWSVAGDNQSLFDAPAGAVNDAPSSVFSVPRLYLDLAADVALHGNPSRFALLYRLLWRLRTEPRLLSVAMDPDVSAASDMSKAVHRDIHKMHAFVRFREVPHSEPKAFIAWFEPSHHIVKAATPFFSRRFANFAWAILTPRQSAFWDTHSLSFGPAAHRSDVPADDATEDLWRRYYASIFNPARLKVAAMRSHMPVKYWRNLPESRLIPRLIGEAQQRTDAMITRTPTISSRTARRAPAVAPAEPPEQEFRSLAAARKAAANCRMCPLWKDATQTVFGKGRQSAAIMFVGEQPGDQEDLAGEPFVGPAGKVLNRALSQVGIDRSAVYVTNAVKHFKFEPRGKRRIHKKPNEAEIAACHSWLANEMSLVEPQLVVALGATAVRAVLGRTLTIESTRGRIIKAESAGAPDILVTVHPSYLLRMPEEDKQAAYDRFVADLELGLPYATAG